AREQGTSPLEAQANSKETIGTLASEFRASGKCCQNRKSTEVDFTRETRGSNLRRIPAPKSEGRGPQDCCRLTPQRSGEALLLRGIAFLRWKTRRQSRPSNSACLFTRW